MTLHLQSHCRKFLARSDYKKMKKAAITTQCAWRARVARKELRKLKMVTFCLSVIFIFFKIFSASCNSGVSSTLILNLVDVFGSYGLKNA